MAQPRLLINDFLLLIFLALESLDDLKEVLIGGVQDIHLGVEEPDLLGLPVEVLREALDLLDGPDGLDIEFGDLRIVEAVEVLGLDQLISDPHQLFLHLTQPPKLLHPTLQVGFLTYQDLYLLLKPFHIGRNIIPLTRLNLNRD